jgi:hypothetical protein
LDFRASNLPVAEILEKHAPLAPTCVLIQAPFLDFVIELLSPKILISSVLGFDSLSIIRREVRLHTWAKSYVEFEGYEQRP